MKNEEEKYLTSDSNIFVRSINDHLSVTIPANIEQSGVSMLIDSSQRDSI